MRFIYVDAAVSPLVEEQIDFGRKEEIFNGLGPVVDQVNRRKQDIAMD